MKTLFGRKIKLLVVLALAVSLFAALAVAANAATYTFDDIFTGQIIYAGDVVNTDKELFVLASDYLCLGDSSWTASRDYVVENFDHRYDTYYDELTQEEVVTEDDYIIFVSEYNVGVAKIGSTTYETLEAAFAAAQDGDTITLLSDCSGNGIQVPAGKFQPAGLTVDFAGFTYTVNGTLVGSAKTANQCFQLLKDNTITFKNGTVTVDNANVSWTDRNNNVRQGAAMIIQNYSNLTLDNMTIDGTGSSVDYAVSNNNGATTIKESTINSHEGGVAFDVWYGLSSTYPSVSVTVIDSTINGDVEVGSQKATGFEGNLSLSIEGNTTIEGDINNSSSQAVQAVMEENITDFVTVEETATLSGDNNFVPAEPEVPTTNGKTLIVYNLDKVDGQARIAVFAGIDSLDYERVGFEITQNGVTKTYTTRWVSTAVEVTSDVPGVSHVYEAAEFENGAQYVFGQFIDVEDDSPVTVRAFAITNAGQQVVNDEAPAVEDAYTMMTFEGTAEGASGFQPGPAIPGFGG